MTIVPVALSSSSNKGRTGRENSARLINCYSENIGQDGKHQDAVYACEGLAQSGATLSSSGGVRAMIAIETDMYVVCGRDVVRLPLSGTASVIYTLPGDGHVYTARNRRSPDVQIGIVADGLYYVIQSGVMTLISDPDLPPPTSIAVFDGYFLLPTTEGRWFITGEDDATTISALDFGRAQRQPDNIVRAFAGERDVILFGSDSIEWWQNNPDGSASFPFIPSASVAIGCLAPRSVVKLDRSIAWVASDGTVRMLNGYGGDRISDYAVERDIGSVTSPAEDIYAFAYHCRDTGHSFITITSGDWTWQYNLKTGRWNERQTYGRSRWRGSYAAEFNGVWYVGDDETGIIYTVNGNNATDGDQPLVTTLQTPTVHAFPARLKVNAAFLDVVTGVGLVASTDANVTPQLIFDMSHDGGASFGAERLLDMGVAGNRQRRIRTNRLGVIGPNGAVFRMRVSAAVTRCFMSMSLDADRMAV